jgi:hypothetical protein
MPFLVIGSLIPLLRNLEWDAYASSVGDGTYIGLLILT